jgi:hypothetical protein
LQRLAILKKNHLDEQYVARRSVRDLPATIASLSERLAKLTEDEATAAAHASDCIVIGGRSCSPDDATAVLAGHLDSLSKHVHELQRVPIGHYRGLRFGMVLHPQFPPDVYLAGATTRQSMLSREHHGPRAVLNAVERLATAYGSECDRLRKELAIAEAQLRDYTARLGKVFPHETILADISSLRDQLKASLSGAHAKLTDDCQLSVELTERFKALRAAKATEDSLGRVQRSSSPAEEPVTARIRRRMIVLTSDPNQPVS